MPDPEQRARLEIDQQLQSAGWLVQDRAHLNIAAGPGVAVREVVMPGAGEADYLLIAERKAVGIVEAKKIGDTLTGVESRPATMLRPSRSPPGLAHAPAHALRSDRP